MALCSKCGRYDGTGGQPADHVCLWCWRDRALQLSDLCGRLLRCLNGDSPYNAADLKMWAEEAKRWEN